MSIKNALHYKLQSLLTSRLYEDSGWLLDAPGETRPTLIRAVYEKDRITVGPDELGLYRFGDWLPVRRFLLGSAPPVTFKSIGLGGRLGLDQLYITFSGYWPEKGGLMKTCSFKETEAYSVCGRLDESLRQVLVVASAGNTARAFAQVCSDNEIPLLLCVPEDNLDAIWSVEPLNPCVKLVCTRGGSDYFDAIHLSNLACQVKGFIAEGGARNVARRDGMGTTVLSAATSIGRIPDYYFQAVGSGTGAIAAWEANLRLIADGRFGNHRMKLMVSQNAPFLPIYDAWQAGSRDMLPMDDDAARRQVEEIMAKVLSNRRPPYSITGGLYDALTDAGGEVFSVTNHQAMEAAAVFEETEGIDIHPAAAVATASLIHCVASGAVDREKVIMLNITGGGEARLEKENELHPLNPAHIFDINPDLEDVAFQLGRLF
jgi:cysteate synthase